MLEGNGEGAIPAPPFGAAEQRGARSRSRAGGASNGMLPQIFSFVVGIWSVLVDGWRGDQDDWHVLIPAALNHGGAS